MMVVDASVWVSYVLRADVHHALSFAWIQGHFQRGQRLVAPLLLVVEVGGAISRRTGDANQGRRTVSNLLRIPLMRWVALDARLTIAAARHAWELQLRGADAVYVAVAEQLNVPLVSWDGEHHARAVTRVQVYAPDAFIIPPQP